MGARKKRPLVSIVTPSYNQGRFIEETIESVLSQDYPNIEYIVVDGASTDNTVEILKKYGDRIKWTSEPDSGQADAIAKGFASSKGEILAYLNSDDVYTAGAVSRVVDFFKQHPHAGMVYGKCSFIDEEGTPAGEYPTEEFDSKRLAVFNFISQPSAFFTKKAYTEAGGMDARLSYVMDYDLWIRLTRVAGAEYLPERLSLFRLHAGSKTVDDTNAADNLRETLDTVIRHYGWAPATRVYACCWSMLRLRVPGFMARSRVLMTPLTALIALLWYIRLNRGLRAEDLKSLSLANIRKMASGRVGFYR